MRKIILTSLIGIISISIMGCSSQSDKQEDDYVGFELISNEKQVENLELKEIMDKETGVHYYVNTRAYYAFMSPVYNNDGTIKVTNER